MERRECSVQAAWPFEVKVYRLWVNYLHFTRVCCSSQLGSPPISFGLAILFADASAISIELFTRAFTLCRSTSAMSLDPQDRKKLQTRCVA
jgi:hypothetical protein